MKRLYYLIYIGFIACFFACQSDEDLVSNIGYLRLSVGAGGSANTKAVPENYKPKQIAVQIVNAQGKVVEETDDSETWVDPIALETGTYTVKASSNGFDGQESGFDIPYYAGSKEITIKSNQEVQETIVCTLANVKVTVKFDASFLEKFAGRDISVQVGDQTGTNKFTPLNFSTAETRSAYFPVGNLYATLSVSNPDKPLEPYTLKQEFTEVKAKDHYMLNYKLQESGETNITVTVDPTMHEYSYTFTVSTEATNNASLTAGAWDRLAYLKAENVTTASGVSMEGITFQYRVKTNTPTKVDETPWTDVATTASESTYTAMLTGLTASTTYEYRLANGEGESIGSVKEFTTGGTDLKTTLQNGGFEDWYKSGSVWYAATQTDVSNKTYMWDSSNPGSGSFGFNPTTGSTDIKHGGNYSAKLETQYAYIKLAAASLYYGRFNDLVGTSGAKIDFGQSFTSRPIALKGYFQYAPVAIDRVGGSQPANTVSKGDMDVCSIFIILSKGTYQLNNTITSTLLSEEKVKNTDQFIAYGELPISECVSTNGQWKEFNIPLKYKEDAFGEEPTHLIIVCSSSKYGDYFTGGTGSTLYLDDFELIYDGEPTIWK
ncbi:MAG: PCMD domain-containing protein [Parabacteroides sp.]|nr:PCMD domain-containing protein [Parabacteroides sp.]MDY5623896.1 PCMD domain-containing protein [Bacteroidales bacterium]